MGQEDVSVMRERIYEKLNFCIHKTTTWDTQRSRKEKIMKMNGKKRIFALLMCVMMIVSSMSVWAAYTSRTIGDIPREQAECELYLTSSFAEASTIPITNYALAVSTAISAVNRSNTYTSSDGSSYCSVSGSKFVTALSTHQAGPFYTSLQLTL